MRFWVSDQIAARKVPTSEASNQFIINVDLIRVRPDTEHTPELTGILFDFGALANDRSIGRVEDSFGGI